MKIEGVGNRGVLFTFDDDTAVYLIVGENRLYLCDTHCGPDSMEYVKNYLEEHGWMEKPLVVFNTHSDWDHIWGNSAFPDAPLIAHEACRARMAERAHLDLQMVPEESRRGEIKLRLPNLTFADRLTFAGDQVEFFHAPGHTICSTICHDLVDSVLFVGDLVEVPIPYVLYHDVPQFIATLEEIKNLASNHTIITAHSGLVGVEEIDNNIAYLRALLAGNGGEEAGDRQALHHYNRNNLQILKVEQAVRAQLGSSFNYEAFLRRLAVALGVDSQDLRALRSRIRQIDHQELIGALNQHFA